MSRRRRITEESSTKVPAYIVTFSDMTTLLLTFFVMLISLATVQEEELFHRGRESFLKSMEQLGLGVLYGGKAKPDFGNIKIKYFISRPDELSGGRTIDEKKERARRIFKRLSQSMTTMSSQIVAKETNFSITDIRFPRGNSILNESAKRFLKEFCVDLQQDPDAKAVGLYVLGLAGDEASEKEQWVLSAKRAQVVADFLRDILSSGLSPQAKYSARGNPSRWPVYSWGAGPGGDWVDRDGSISGKSQILIAVLRTNE